MNTETVALVITAASIGFFHTLLGPDHYLPFIMMSWAGKWSRTKTIIITFVCGIGHILSSVVLGFIGVLFGVAVNKLVDVESTRGSVAVWLLIAFGLMYFVWGLRQAYKNKPHSHGHLHPTDEKSGHSHEHTHRGEHAHAHISGKASVTPWMLFLIFIFGPCEPLIPILMYPAAKNNFWQLVLVTFIFAAITIGTMLGVVMLGLAGVEFLPLKKLSRYAHPIGGATILICGLAIHFLGL